MFNKTYKFIVQNLAVILTLIFLVIFIFKFFGVLAFIVINHVSVFTILYNLDSSLLFLSGFGALIAYYQYNLQKEQFKKELFDERLEIFNILEKIVKVVFENPENIGKDFYHELNINLNKAYFLFDQKTYQFIKTFRQNCINFYYAQKNYRPYMDMNWGSITDPEEHEQIKEKEKRMLDTWNSIIAYNDLDKLAEEFPQLKFNETQKS
jgi:hypothetical protein